jgi:hypothetical protein
VVTLSNSPNYLNHSLSPSNVNIVTCWGLRAWYIRRVLDWIHYTLYIHLGTSGKYSSIAELHNLPFTITHALGFSVFTSRILATNLQQSHCHFKSHVMASFHSLIPFMTFLFNHLQNSTELSTTTRLLGAAQHFFMTTLHGPHKKYRLYF